MNRRQCCRRCAAVIARLTAAGVDQASGAEQHRIQRTTFELLSPARRRLPGRMGLHSWRQQLAVERITADQELRTACFWAAPPARRRRQR